MTRAGAEGRRSITKRLDVSRATMGRIPLYLKYLKSAAHDAENISATQLARALALGDDELLARSARNMLTDAAISLCPEVRETLCALRELGASFCAMSGSGSACLALFPEKRFPTKEELCLFPSFCLPTYTTAG